MLESREGVATHRDTMPIGDFYKKLIRNKYRNVCELKPELSDSIVFCESIKTDAKFTATVKHPNQLHFTTKEDSNGVYELEIESGNFQTFEQLLTQNPAVVTGKDFVNNVISQMADLLVRLHSEQVYQVCMAPQCVFARKNDNKAMLFYHGSFFGNASVVRAIYEGFESYVAPEVLEGATPDERSDVFAFGKFIERMLADTSPDYVFRKVLSKATAADPLQRYASIDDMTADLKNKKGLKSTAIAAAAALLIALLAIGGYFTMLPDPVIVEFVDNNGGEYEDPFQMQQQHFEDPLIDDADSAETYPEDITADEALTLEAQRLFRRQFTREADQVLSKIYSREKMNSSEQAFIASSNSLMNDLMKKRDELADKAGLEPEDAVKISNEIINSIRDEKQKELKSFGVQK